MPVEPGKLLLSVKNLSVHLEEYDILTDINFSVKADEILAIVGPNGAGKSVMFRALLGLVPHKGTVVWHGEPRISYIPQRLAVDKEFPLSVGEFFGFKTDNFDKIASALKSVGITDEYHVERHLLKKRLGTLSGGQFQRIMIAWSLVDNPDVLLYDEPTSGIDAGGEETIYTLLSNLKARKNLTIIIISHDLNMVYKYATSVICLNKEMICHGAPGDVLDSESLTKLYGKHNDFHHHEHQH